MATSAATVAAAMAVRARRDMIERLTERGAFDPEHAVALELPSGMHGRQLGRLIDRGIVHDSGARGYWLDRAALERDEQRRSEAAKLVFKVLAVFTVIVIVLAAALVVTRH
jgi:hypothetical protein